MESEKKSQKQQKQQKIAKILDFPCFRTIVLEIFSEILEINYGKRKKAGIIIFTLFRPAGKLTKKKVLSRTVESGPNRPGNCIIGLHVTKSTEPGKCEVTHVNGGYM